MGDALQRATSPHGAQQHQDAQSALELDRKLADAAHQPAARNCDAALCAELPVEWKNLKVRQLIHFPRSYSEFEAKAKNWLNWHRAPNYGATLFPDSFALSAHIT